MMRPSGLRVRSETQAALRSAIADYCGVTPAQVVAGSGADDLIDILLRVVLPKAIVNCTPTFGMYDFLARIGGARVIEVPRLADFAVDVPGVAEPYRQLDSGIARHRHWLTDEVRPARQRASAAVVVLEVPDVLEPVVLPPIGVHARRARDVGEIPFHVIRLIVPTLRP